MDFADKPEDQKPDAAAGGPDQEASSAEELRDSAEDFGYAEVPESPSSDAGDGEQSIAEELELERERAAARAAEEAATIRYVELDAAGNPLEASPPEAGGALDAIEEDAADANEAPPTHPPFLGPVTDLNDLPQAMLAHMSPETAGELHRAIQHPEQFPEGHLDHTSIRGLHAVGPESEQKKDGEPWYHLGLPPLYLEVALVKYDWMVGEALRRAARHIDRLTESKVESKIQAAMFHLRSELRQLYR